MKKIIGYITTFWRRKEIYEQEYEWIPSFVQELGFTKISYTNHGLNQTFYHKNKDQKLFLSIELSPHKRAWDVINIQLTSNKKYSIILKKKWGVWSSSLHNEDWKKEIRNVSEAFFSVDVSLGEKEPLLLYEGLKLEDIYIVPPHAVLVCSKKIEGLIIKAFNLGCKKLSNVRPLKIAYCVEDVIDEKGRNTGGILWEDQLVGSAHIEERV